jgi:hypothetical protein
MPCRRYDQVTAVDAIIKNYADDKSIYYLDLVPLMTPIVTTGPDGKPDTTYRGLGPDHLHPDAEGYQLWADAMEPLLRSWLPLSDAKHPGEKHDRAGQQPERLSRMRDAYEAWFREVTSGPDNADLNVAQHSPRGETVVPQ